MSVLAPPFAGVVGFGPRVRCDRRDVSRLQNETDQISAAWSGVLGEEGFIVEVGGEFLDIEGAIEAGVKCIAAR